MPTEKTLEYTLNKAPVGNIIEVTGTLNGSSHTFVEGTDYELSPDDEEIVWKESGDVPDENTEFTVEYMSQSVMSRYVDVSQDEIDTVEDRIDKAIKAKFVDQATTKQLDELGDLFGDIGKRRGRNNTEYRRFLKSTVDSVTSRGTREGIKLAVAAVADVPVDEIIITEDFNNNSYTVAIDADASFNSNDVSLAAETSDPSGVEFEGTATRTGGASIDISVTEATVTDTADALGSQNYTLGGFTLGE